MIALLLAAALAGQGDVAGLWRTPSGNGLVEITHCAGAAICGRLISSDTIRADPGLKDVRNKDASLRGRTLKGLVLFEGFGGGPRQWTGERIYNPEEGGTYHAEVRLAAPDKLKVKGCLAALLCRTQTWVRAR
jgi:uncharacterized protein (DUF2147 family)